IAVVEVGQYGHHRMQCRVVLDHAHCHFVHVRDALDDGQSTHETVLADIQQLDARPPRLPVVRDHGNPRWDWDSSTRRCARERDRTGDNRNCPRYLSESISPQHAADERPQAAGHGEGAYAHRNTSRGRDDAARERHPKRDTTLTSGMMIRDLSTLPAVIVRRTMTS